MVTINNAATIGTAPTSIFYTSAATLDLNGISDVASGGGIVINGGGTGSGLDGGNTTQAMLAAANGALYNSSSTAASTASGTTITINTGLLVNAKQPTIGGWGDIEIKGVIQDGTSGTAGTTLAWNKVGLDTLTLSGANTFAGILNLNAGVVKLNNATALGTTGSATNNFTNVASGATLDLNGQGTAEFLTLNGAGVTGVGYANTLGALVNNGAAATVSGNIILASGSTVGSSSFGAGLPAAVTAAGFACLGRHYPQRCPQWRGNNFRPRPGAIPSS